MTQGGWVCTAAAAPSSHGSYSLWGTAPQNQSSLPGTAPQNQSPSPGREGSVLPLCPVCGKHPAAGRVKTRVKRVKRRKESPPLGLALRCSRSVFLLDTAILSGCNVFPHYGKHPHGICFWNDTAQSWVVKMPLISQSTRLKTNKVCKQFCTQDVL